MMIPCQCHAIPALAPGKDSGPPDSESDDSAAWENRLAFGRRDSESLKLTRTHATNVILFTS